jgi:hypothetical protein
MRVAAVLVALGALAAIVALNVFLLGRSVERHDPVGKLSPIAAGLGPIAGTSGTTTVVVHPPPAREPDD